MTRQASCSCGQLRLTCEGEPIRVSLCHCLECQRRTGSVFGTGARFAREQVTRIDGESTRYVRTGESGDTLTFHFCPVCGTTVYWQIAALPDFTMLAVGAFADPQFTQPIRSIYENRRHPWIDHIGAMPLDREGA